MYNKDRLEDLLSDLQFHTIKHILDEIQQGQATPQTIRNALTVLKDNGFTLRDTTTQDPAKFLEDLNSAMPKLPTISTYGEIIEDVEFTDIEVV